VTALRERGVLGTARADIDYTRLGFAVHAFIRLSAPTKISFKLLEKVLARPETLSLSFIAGDGLMIIEMIARDVNHLHRFLTWLQEHGDSETFVKLSTHRSQMPLRQRLDEVEAMLSKPDERLGY
jgi:DNA-binding Lrp family transcriptional regulator